MAETTAHIRKMLDLNTSHLPERIGSIALCILEGVIAYEIDYGWLMWVPEDPIEESKYTDVKMEDVILTIQLYAREHDCDYVLFDRDGPICNDLETWEW